MLYNKFSHNDLPDLSLFILGPYYTTYTVHPRNTN